MIGQLCPILTLSSRKDPSILWRGVESNRASLKAIKNRQIPGQESQHNSSVILL